MNSFSERIQTASRVNRSLVCVGLDPDPKLMPIPNVLEFNKAIIDATKDLVCAYKPNLSFYEAIGREGISALEQTVSYIRSVCSDVIIIGDGKRGDIASSNIKYAKALFEGWGFDAITVNGYAGGESLKPFLDHKDKGIFVWCRSSNPGSQEFQDLRLSDGHGDMPFYEWVARCASQWNDNGNVGLVMGSTYPEELKQVRTRCAGMPILIPGIGGQGGDLEKSVKFGIDSDVYNILISSSRGITYASRNRKEFGTAARKATENLRMRINDILNQEGKGWR